MLVLSFYYILFLIKGNPVAVNDPFRDLVLTSETPASDSELIKLAEAAAIAAIAVCIIIYYNFIMLVVE